MTTIVEEEKIAWIWAYQEALKWFDIFDAENMCTEDNRWTSEIWKRFVTVYGLRRGRYHPIILRNSEAVWNRLAPIFRPQLAEGRVIDELNCRWERAVKLMGEFLPKRQDKRPTELWSMTSKLLWFFHPMHMTMYDDYAHKGLKLCMGRTLGRSEFLSEFDQFFEASKEQINLAGKYSNRVYPYPRRVADMRLWLKGRPDNNEAAILRAFRKSLCLAPFKRQ